MIYFNKFINRKSIYPYIQVLCIGLSVCFSLIFLRHSLVSSATAFRLDFERQSFIELSKGDSFTVARKLGALGKSSQIHCIRAKKNGIVFFEEMGRDCETGFWLVAESVNEANHGISIDFYLGHQTAVVTGFWIFVAMQLLLLFVTLLVQSNSIRMDFQRDRDMANLARQVAHDIKSPLAVLSIFHKKLTHDLAPEVPLRALESLSLLVDHLMGKEKSPKNFLLKDLLKEVVDQKSIEHMGQAEIQCNFYDDSAEAFLPGPALEWQRVFSNLFNNAIESHGGQKSFLQVHCRKTQEALEIEIVDQGKGIPKEILNRIGEKGYSYGKEQGSGLGIFSAKNFINSCGGSLNILPGEERGTRVIIRLREKAKSMVVLIDDDAQLAQVWKKVAQKRGLEFLYFSTPEAFLLEAEKIPFTASIYLDVEIPESSRDSLHFGAQLKRIGFRQIILTTGHGHQAFSGLSWASAVVGKEPPFA